MRRTIVILFASDQTTDPHKPCDLSHCPMEAHSFATRDEAEDFARHQPAWTQPHFLYDQQPDNGRDAHDG